MRQDRNMNDILRQMEYNILIFGQTLNSIKTATR